MGVDAIIAGQGITRNGARIFGLTAMFAILATTAYGLLAPTFIARLAPTDIASIDDALLPVFGAAFAFSIGSVILGYRISRTVVDRWRPAQPKVVDRPSRGLTLANVLAPLSLIIGPRLGSDALPHASNLYVVPGVEASWLRVVAPADFAYAAIVALLLWTFAWIVAVVVVLVWTRWKTSAIADSQVRDDH